MLSTLLTVDLVIFVSCSICVEGLVLLFFQNCLCLWVYLDLVVATRKVFEVTNLYR